MHAEVKTFKNDFIQISEVYDTRNNSLDYVVMYFCYNPENYQQIENQIKEYRKNKSTCLIGCIKSNDEKYSDLKKPTSLFDVHLDSASDLDFENLIDFCISTEDSVLNCELNDFKSQRVTEISIYTSQNNSIAKLIENLQNKISIQLENRSEEKYPKVVISLMSNGRELQISEVKEFMDSISGYLTDDAQCMLNTCDCMEKLKKDEIKVTGIFFEKKTRY